MLQNIIWAISFISLYIALVWLNFLYLDQPEKKAKLTKCPSVTLVISAYNEEDSIARAIKSAVSSDYPPESMELIVVNDGSTDKTKEIVERIAKEHKNIVLINTRHNGKGSALNLALKNASGELFAVLDADCIIDKKALKNIVHHFQNEKVAAVVSNIKVNKPRNLYERVQRLEYLLAVLIRRLMAAIDTLAMTPGVLSVYRTDVLKEVGCFDEENYTEDFEMAMRLRYHGYSVKTENSAVSYTNVPHNFHTLWRQRIRWFRGFIQNNIKYRSMFFSRKHGILGFFQLPINIVAILVLLVSISIITTLLIKNSYEFILRSIMIKGYLLSLFDLPTLKEFVLGYNLKIMLPIYIALLSTLYLFYIAHKQTNEKIQHPLSILAFFLVFPYLISVHWISAITQEIAKLKRKW